MKYDDQKNWTKQYKWLTDWKFKNTTLENRKIQKNPETKFIMKTSTSKIRIELSLPEVSRLSYNSTFKEMSSLLIISDEKLNTYNLYDRSGELFY